MSKDLLGLRQPVRHSQRSFGSNRRPWWPFVLLRHGLRRRHTCIEICPAGSLTYRSDARGSSGKPLAGVP